MRNKFTEIKPRLDGKFLTTAGIDKNKIFAAVCFAVLFTVVFMIEKNVHYYGDDYYYLTFSGSNFWLCHLEHYTNDNGRFIVHLLDTVFLSKSLVFWRAANALMLTVTAYIAYRLCGEIKAAFIPCALLLYMPIGIARESVYWVTGSFNYVYPAMMLMLYWYALHKNGSAALICIAAFFATASAEQAAVAANALTLCYILFNAFIIKAPFKKYTAAMAVTVIGAASVFLAPGNFNRMALEGVGSTSSTIFSGTDYILHSAFTADYTILFYITAVLMSSVYLWRNGLKIPAALGGTAAFFAAVCNKIWYFSQMSPMFYIIFALTTCVFVPASVLYYKRNNSIIPILTIIIGVSSCSFTVLSPTLGARILFLPCIMYIVYISCFSKDVCLKKSEKAAICAGALICAAVFGAVLTMRGYYINSPVYRDNEALIESYFSAGSDGEPLHQKKLILEDYGWSMPYNSEYHEYYYKIYYGIPEDTEILWE